MRNVSHLLIKLLFVGFSLFTIVSCKKKNSNEITPDTPSTIDTTSTNASGKIKRIEVRQFYLSDTNTITFYKTNYSYNSKGRLAESNTKEIFTGPNQSQEILHSTKIISYLYDDSNNLIEVKGSWIWDNTSTPYTAKLIYNTDRSITINHSVTDPFNRKTTSWKHTIIKDLRDRITSIETISNENGRLTRQVFSYNDNDTDNVTQLTITSANRPVSFTYAYDTNKQAFDYDPLLRSVTDLTGISGSFNENIPINVEGLSRNNLVSSDSRLEYTIDLRPKKRIVTSNNAKIISEYFY